MTCCGPADHGARVRPHINPGLLGRELWLPLQLHWACCWHPVGVHSVLCWPGHCSLDDHELPEAVVLQ